MYTQYVEHDDITFRPRVQYTTTSNVSTIDKVGTALAKGVLALAGGVVERIDPGLAPGIDVITRAIGDNFDRENVARGTRTTSTIVYDPIHSYTYNYEPIGQPPDLRGYHLPTGFSFN